MSSWNRQSLFKGVVIGLFWGGFLLLFVPFFPELLLAGIAALAMHPFLGRLFNQRLVRWRTFVTLYLVAMFVVVAVPVSVVGYKVYIYIVGVTKSGLQNTPAFQNLVTIKQQVVEILNRALETVGLAEHLDLAGMSEEALSRSTNALVQFLSSLVSRAPSILISLFVFCAALYYFLAEAGPLRNLFERQRVLARAEANRFVSLLQKSCYNTVVSSVVISTLQATIVAVGGWVFSAGDFAVVWVVTFFCSFIPVIGAGPVALALALGQVVMGEYGRAVGLVVVAVVGGTLDNVIRPYIIASGAEDLHPVVSLLAIIGALVIFGMPGLFLGPVIATVAIKIVPTLTGDQRAPKS